MTMLNLFLAFLDNIVWGQKTEADNIVWGQD
jgi:hypothetical protein